MADGNTGRTGNTSVLSGQGGRLYGRRARRRGCAEEAAGRGRVRGGWGRARRSVHAGVEAETAWKLERASPKGLGVGRPAEAGCSWAPRDCDLSGRDRVCRGRACRTIKVARGRAPAGPDDVRDAGPHKTKWREGARADAQAGAAGSAGSPLGWDAQGVTEAPSLRAGGERPGPLPGGCACGWERVGAGDAGSGRGGAGRPLGASCVRR